jgi:hypothetical protein
LAERRSIYVGTGIESGRPPRRAMTRRSPLLLRRINEVMRDGRRGRIEAECIPFFGECERDDCYEPFWLTADDYDARRTEARRSLILPGHETRTSRNAAEPRVSRRELRSHPDSMDRGGSEKARQPRAPL